MTVLSLSDIESVNRVITEIYAVRKKEEFYKKIVPLLKELFSSDIASYNEFDSRPRLTKVINDSHDHDEIFRKHEAAAKSLIPTHPCFSISSLDRCTLLSDIICTDMFKKTELYNEYYRHFEVQSQLYTELPCPQGNRGFLAFGRDMPFFSERERFLLSLIRPQVIQAYRNIVELNHYKERLALFEQGDDFPALRTRGLTNREATILGWAAKGKTNLEIALILGISRRTVEKHFERIYEKLGVETKIAAISVIVNTPPVEAEGGIEGSDL